MASAPAVHAAPAPVGEFMESAPSVHAAPAPVGEFMASAPSVLAAPGSSGDDASCVEQDIDVEGVDYLGRVVYHSGTCEFHDMAEYIWRSQGVGTFRLLRHSTGVKFFQFWRLRQLLVEDVISGLVLHSGDKGRSWRWLDPKFKDGPNDYRHAVRFQTPVQARRFHEEWYSSQVVRGEGLGIPSPLLGCQLLAGFAGDDALCAVFSSVLLVQQTVEIPHLQFICVVVVLPDVTHMASLMVQTARGPSRFPSCSSTRWSMSLFCRMPFGTLQCACLQLQLWNSL